MPIYWDSTPDKAASIIVRRCDWCKKMYDAMVTRAKDNVFCSIKCEREFNSEHERTKRISGE